MSSSTVARIEREQKFLVDVDEFTKFLQTSKGIRSSYVRQCYLALDRGDGGFEVRFREATVPAAVWGDASSNAFLTAWTQTFKRRRDRDEERDEVEFDVERSAFNLAWTTTTWRIQKTRHTGGDLGAWQVDVFRDGPLNGVAVAEMELPEGCRDIGQYHAERALYFPKWLLRRDTGDLFHDLTAERVNLVGTGAVEPSPRLRVILDAERDRRTIKAKLPQISYATSPRNRQGVVDLDATARLRKAVGR